MLIEWQLILDADVQPELTEERVIDQGVSGNYDDIVFFNKLLEIERRINELDLVKEHRCILIKIKRMLNAVFLLMLLISAMFAIHMLDL